MEKEAYFREWLKHHSISEGAPSGAHINMSISDDLVELVYQQLPQRFENKVAAQNYLYQIIVQGFMRYRWFLTYLFGASPMVLYPVKVTLKKIKN